MSNDSIGNFIGHDIGWHYFSPNYDELYTITKFDDGNERFQEYENEWLMFGSWRGKCALLNRLNSEIRIYSISNWKVTRREIQHLVK
jgi:hypothetical protein